MEPTDPLVFRPIANYAMSGRSNESRLDMPTLDHVLAVEEWRNGRKGAGSGLSASDAIVAKADLHLAHGYDQSECGSPIMAYLHALGTLNSVRASFILDCDRFLLIASVCRTPMTVVSMQLLI